MSSTTNPFPAGTLVIIRDFSLDYIWGDLKGLGKTVYTTCDPPFTNRDRIEVGLKVYKVDKRSGGHYVEDHTYIAPLDKLVIVKDFGEYMNEAIDILSI